MRPGLPGYEPWYKLFLDWANQWGGVGYLASLAAFLVVVRISNILTGAIVTILIGTARDVVGRWHSK